MTHDAYSTKRVTAWPQERDGVAGVAIKYQDGYQSWCPQATFARDYQPITAMSFGHAIHALKQGKRVARAGWNGKSMWLLLINDWTIHQLYAHEVDGLLPLSWIGMKTADGGFVPWLASQTDVLAEDWLIVGEV